MNGVNTIPSRALGVWRRLYRRYSLEPFPASVSPDVSKTIVPITNADVLLATASVRTSGLVALTAAGGLTTMHTVPAGERWTLSGFDIFRVDGDRLLNNVSLVDPVNSLPVALDRPANVTSLTTIFASPMVLDEAWTIQARAAGGTTDGDWTMDIYVLIEQTF